MSTEKKATTKWTYWLSLAIGFGFMFGFPLLPAIEPITEVGMTVLGVFLGMVILWSTMDTAWPSILGLLLVALSGYLGPDTSGYAAVKEVFKNALGAENVIATTLGMMLFGGLAYDGDDQVEHGQAQ